MKVLTLVKGPENLIGRQFSLEKAPAVIGRSPDAEITLPSQTVSRRHAVVHFQDGLYFVEDLGSRNGIFINQTRVVGRSPFLEADELVIADFTFVLEEVAGPEAEKSSVVVREQVTIGVSNQDLFQLNPGRKLQVVLELSQHLSLTPEPDALFSKLLDQLLTLFPRADRGMVVLCEKDKLVVRAQRSRHGDRDADFSFSRTILRKALADGVGILSEDAAADQRFEAAVSLQSSDTRSFLCVPLLGHEGRRLGVVQLTCSQVFNPFRSEDLHLLTTVAMQVSVVLENAAMHADRLLHAQLRKELEMAREIQQSFLPANFTPLPGGAYELYARVYSALDVSGDLYDFFPLDDGRLAFLAGDVSGKGMPAALFMVAVRSLGRLLAMDSTSPARTLTRLDAALAVENSSAQFVTVVHGIFDPRTGATLLSCGGHPPALLRRADGSVAEVAMPSGRLLGFGGQPNLTDTAITLEPDETLILYTDGCTEASAPAPDESMFGLERLCHALGGLRTKIPLAACAEKVHSAIERFTGSSVLQDDITLLLLRRRPA